MKEWNDDKALFSLIKEELYTAVIGDIMDKMGYTRQFLPPQIRPLRDDMLVAGRAMTVLEADVLEHGKECGENPLLKRSFGLMLEALDDLKEDEVYVCSGSSPCYALWGELMSARAMRGALDILKPLMQGQVNSYIGRIVIGTVKGDLHDIGKNLVASMFEGCGFEVINLGVDVSSDKFISAALENKADIICMSALLTTTMNYMKEVIDALETSGLRGKVKVMVGGAPVSDAFAKSIGADAYTSNANAAVIMAKKLINAC